MRTLFLFLVLCTTTPLPAQQGFLQSYDLGEAGLGFHNMLLKEDTLMVCGTVCVQEFQQWGLVFLKMDTSGNILEQQMHFDALGDSYSFEQNYEMISTTDGGYALVGQMVSRNFPVLIKLDQDGELEFIQEYPDTTVYNIRHWSIVEVPNGYITNGVKQQINDGLWDAFIMRTDIAGNKQWEISYGDQGRRDRLQGINKIANNEYLLTGSTFNTTGDVEDVSDLWTIPKAVKIDTLGNIIWQWQGPIDYAGGPNPSFRSLHPTLDGNWVNEGSISTIIDNEIFFQGEIVKRDTNFNVIWNTSFGLPTSYRNNLIDISASPDGGWVAAGQYVETGDDIPFGGYRAAMIAKVNADGDSLWSRLDTLFDHTQIASTPYLSGVVVLPSGSVIACGHVNKTYPGPGKSYGWLIKVDKDGCMEPGCNDIVNSTNLTPLLENFMAYPNPVADNLTITGSGMYDLQIIGLNGEVLVTKKNLFESVDINMKDYPSGSYYLRIKKGNAYLMRKILKI